MLLKNVSFNVRQGEIVCLAGIEGNGQDELVYALTGLEKQSDGTLTLCGQDISKASIRERSVDGMSHIPADRHKYGLILDYTLEENMVLERFWEPEFQRMASLNSMPSGPIRTGLLNSMMSAQDKGSTTLVRSMSGGNQQKQLWPGK